MHQDDGNLLKLVPFKYEGKEVMSPKEALLHSTVLLPAGPGPLLKVYSHFSSPAVNFLRCQMGVYSEAGKRVE